MDRDERTARGRAADPERLPSLVALGFKVAGSVARDGARRHGFAPDKLEDELIAFRRELEARFFAT